MMDIALIISFALIGTALGCITGLVPGFHANNIAIILLSLYGSISAFLLSISFIKGEMISILMGIIIISTSIAHTFVNIIPSTFIGAPEEDTALLLLPAHSLLLEGRGYEAISLSAAGSYGAVMMAFILLIPFRFLIGPPGDFYWLVDRIVPWILLAVSAVLILTERSKMHVLYAVAVFLLSGIFGMEIMGMDSSSPFGMNISLLFPALAGLFGMPTLLHSLNVPSLPEQGLGEKEVDFVEGWKDVATGTIAGALVSLLPGVTSAVATIMAMVARRKKDRENVIVTLSAVNTATSFFVLAVLFMVEKARSGSAIVLDEIMDVERWSNAVPPYSLCYLLMAVVITSLVSYYATKFFGKIIAVHISHIPYGMIARASVTFIFVMVTLFTGVTGVIVLATGTLIGLLCLELGIRRSLCMGVLILPIMVTYFL